MPEPTSNPITGRTPVVIATLTILALLGFLGVTRLVNRFQEQQKALARHLYEQGLAEQQANRNWRLSTFARRSPTAGITFNIN